MSEKVTKPPRPTITLAFYALLACVVVERLALRFDVGLVEAGAGAAFLFTASALVFFANARRPRSWLPGLAVLLAVCAASIGVCGVALVGERSLNDAFASSFVSEFAFKVDSDMSEGTSGWRGRAKAEAPGGMSGYVWLTCDVRYERGTILRCVGRYSGNSDNDWGMSSRMQGITGTVRVVRVLETSGPTGLRGGLLRLRSCVLEAIQPSQSVGRALVAGLVCGYSSGIRELDLSARLSACGVSHMVAVSGAHLAMITAFLTMALSHTGLGALSRLGLVLATSAAFVAFCGAPLSACRAWAMAVVAAGSQIVGRRGHPVSSVSLVALAMAVIDPTACGQVTYLLSVSSVLGICLFSGYGRYVLRALFEHRDPVRVAGHPVVRRLRDAQGSALDAAAVSIVAQLATLPVATSTFGQLSLVAPVANVVLSVPFSFLMAIGGAAAMLGWSPMLQGPALCACDLLGYVFDWGLGLLSHFPAASISMETSMTSSLIVLFLAGFVLIVWWPSVHRRRLGGVTMALCAVGLAFYLRWRLFAPARVVVLDVGQGDAILVTDGTSSILVDTGPDSSVAQALSRQHVYHLDAVLLTHLHDDHAGGLDDLEGYVSVDQVIIGDEVTPYLTEDLEGCIRRLTGREALEVAYHDDLKVGNFSLRVVSPAEPTSPEENSGSLELLLSYDCGGRSLTALLTGDAEKDETEDVLERADVGDIDFLKVGHHGSAASITSEEAAVLNPEVSVASAGLDNSYGHPKQECVEVLESAGSLFLCTKDVGDVTVEPGASGPVVSCQGESHS